MNLLHEIMESKLELNLVKRRYRQSYPYQLSGVHMTPGSTLVLESTETVDSGYMGITVREYHFEYYTTIFWVFG